jgi:peptidoglycan/LPS O-acetylase OafA/YrhL
MLAAVLSVVLLGSLMMLVVCGSHHFRFVNGHFNLSDSHRDASLRGQHRDRKPQEKAKKQAHGSGMVPQIKSVHQHTVFPHLGLVNAISLGNGQDACSGWVISSFGNCLLTRTTMPKVTILRKTNMKEDSWHSMLISLLRGLAALVVAAAHLRAQVYPGFSEVATPPLLFQGLAFGAGFAYLAVIVFFVLSGWLVGGSFLNKLHSDRAFQNYTIDRISRLWVVLFPTFLVVLLTGAMVGMVDPARVSFSISEAYSVSAFIGNLVGLQTIFVPPFGDNFPLWSLANETWYYVLFPLLVLVFRGRSIAARITAVLAIAAVVQLVHGAIILYFSIWLLGAAFSRVKIEAGPVFRWSMLFLLIGSAVVIRLKGKADVTPEGYPQYFVFSLLFALFLSSMQFKRMSTPMLDWLDRTGRFFANFSFTLYVLHVPLIAVMGHLMLWLFGIGQLMPHNYAHYLVYAAIYLVLVGGAYLFHLPFEARTARVRQWLKSQLFARVGTVQS